MENADVLRIFHSEAAARHGAFRSHRHSAFEISLIISGHGNYRVGERDFSIRRGDIFLYHTNEQHCITDIEEDEPMHILNIQFEPRYFWAQHEQVCFLQTIFCRSRRGDNRIPADTPLNAELRAHILAADAENKTRGVGYEEMIRGHVLAVLILLTRCESDLPEAPFVDKGRLRDVSRSMDYICAHFRKPVTLAEIAGVANLSRAYYCVVFKQLNGITPWEYVNMRRLDAARQMLRESDETVLSVAMQCGFNNTANFNRIFRNDTGMTPHAYRAAHPRA